MPRCHQAGLQRECACQRCPARGGSRGRADRGAAAGRTAAASGALGFKRKRKDAGMKCGARKRRSIRSCFAALVAAQQVYRERDLFV